MIRLMTSALFCEVIKGLLFIGGGKGGGRGGRRDEETDEKRKKRREREREREKREGRKERHGHKVGRDSHQPGLAHPRPKPASFSEPAIHGQHIITLT